MSIEHADFDGIERLALSLAARSPPPLTTPDQVKLGHCDLIEEIIIGRETH